MTTISDPFPGAVIPEAVIAAVMAAGAVPVFTRRPAARGAAVMATLFALLGTAYGLTVTLGAGSRAGATPDQVSAGLAAAQVLPALAGAILGLAGGIGLAEVLDDDPVTIPPSWQLLAVVLGCVVVMTALTAIPARISARRPAGRVLQTELA